MIITHEHYDHVSFLASVLKRTQADLYINRQSFDRLDYRIRANLPRVRVKFLEADTRYVIGDLEILTLKLAHDSANNFGYVFISGGKRLAYVTDTGFFPLKYLELIKNVDALIIESNHDVEMLMESDRPWALKERILSPNGHMSNHICQQVLTAVLNDGTRSSSGSYQLRMQQPRHHRSATHSQDQKDLWRRDRPGRAIPGVKTISDIKSD